MMADDEKTHLIYYEDRTNPNNIVRTLFDRYYTKTAAKSVLDLMLMDRRWHGAYPSGDDIRIMENNRVIKLWIIAETKNEKSLKLKYD